VLGIAGLAILVYGLSLFSLPLALSVLGLSLLLMGYILACIQRDDRNDQPPG